ncbi:hypothetical protein GlitD10_0833 [Gloeomargarita lithophora Alchichica-D10]|uniref:Uncharacterized protein n=1 Tax=Gloeomargarita lithophora Alchichica-D10 TaxID=1188229 RepID=A0A1J0AB58_9CYAN|nr:hypothetical protein [Gloeomargarita lithophora]APB33149.1 hypothetical protein GlitD10_0833 [Gloeomargarita lithophora Alchichica-D10]
MLFSDVVESVKNLSLEEKQEIQLLLSQYLREEILKNFQSAKAEQERGELLFSSNVSQLRNMIEK